MSKKNSKSAKPKPTDIIAASNVGTSQPNITGTEGAGPNPVTFRVQANINLSAVADFVIEAANEADAKTKAQAVLDKAHFNISRDLNYELDFCISVDPACVDTEILDVRQTSAALPPRTKGLRSAAETVIGQAVLYEMESRQMPEDGPEYNRDNILAAVGGWDEEANYGMVLQIWRAYLRLYPEQAVGDAEEDARA